MRGSRRRRGGRMSPGSPGWVNFVIDWSQGFEVPDGLPSWRYVEQQVQFSNAHALRRTGVDARITARQWVDVLVAHDMCCAGCGKRAESRQCGVRLKIDHVMPLSKGGVHCVENIQPLCQRCDATKGNSVPS